MECLSALSIANHLRDILIENFMCKEFTNDVLYIRRHLSEFEETRESLIDQYAYHLKAFVEISSQFIGNSKRMENLILISEPFVIYTFDAVYQDSISVLEGEGATQTYNVPKAQKAFYKKFVLLSMRFRKEFENLF